MLSLINANLISAKGHRGGSRPGDRVRRPRAAARGDVGVPHRQYVRSRGVHVVRRILDLVLHPNPRRPAAIGLHMPCLRVPVDVGDLHDLHVLRLATDDGGGVARVPVAGDHVHPARDRRHGSAATPASRMPVGYFGLATAIAAWYASFAAVINSTFGRVHAAGRPAPPISRKTPGPMAPVVT